MLENAACPPLQQGFLEFAPTDPPIPRFVEHENGPVHIWKQPVPTLNYSVGMDVADGGIGKDYTVIQVICNQTGEMVARYRTAGVRPDHAGVDAHLLGQLFNFGLLGIDRNGVGLTTLSVCERGHPQFPEMKGYPNLYYHTYTDRKIPELTNRLGYPCHPRFVVARLAVAIEERALTIFSKTTLMEMLSLAWDPEKGTLHYFRNDEVVALGIANEMRLCNVRTTLKVVNKP